VLIISLLSCQMYNLSSFHTSFPLVVFLTRLFSFYPLNLDSSICHLQNALQQISSWMTANLVTLNSSKTECLHIGHIGLKTNLSKHNSSVDTPHSASNNLLCPNYISVQSLLLSHSPTSIFSGLTRFVNCLYHCYLYRALQT